MTIGRVAQLWRYPVKSLGGEQVEHAEIGPRGVLGDRLWAIRDIERDITASARQLPVLLTATARYRGPVLPDAGPGNVPEVEITFPDGAILSSSDGGVQCQALRTCGPRCRVDRAAARREHQPAPAEPRRARRRDVARFASRRLRRLRGREAARSLDGAGLGSGHLRAVLDSARHVRRPGPCACDEPDQPGDHRRRGRQ